MRKMKNFAHLLLAIIANVIYGFPSRKLKVIGVTGTDGKTTTASLIYEILTANKLKVAVLTTVAAEIDGKSFDTGFHVTTPNPFELQKYLKMAKDAGVTHFVLETTSHGLDQNRVFGVRFAVSVITNISHEHLDYHKTYERYVAAKAKIIPMSDVVVLNKDDKSYPLLEEMVKGKGLNDVITFGLDSNAEVNPEKYPLVPAMPGVFNLYNSLAAFGVCLKLGLDTDIAKRVIAHFTAPKGRQEIVYDKDFKIMIDFAHTPNAFEQLLSALRKESNARLIHVFGSAGERDSEKRPAMGKVSARYSDIIVLTAEDPRGESIDAINKEIKKGISNFHIPISNKNFELENDKKYLFEIPDRQEAITRAISLAKTGDLVVITGKGHEQSMNIGQGEQPWSDHKAVLKALSKKS